MHVAFALIGAAYKRQAPADTAFMQVCDFGLALTVEDATSSVRTNKRGTAQYAAPELLRDGSLCRSSDVYSFGMIAWHLVSQGCKDADMTDAQICYQVSINKHPYKRLPYPLYRAFAPPLQNACSSLRSCMGRPTWAAEGAVMTCTQISARRSTPACAFMLCTHPCACAHALLIES